ARYAGTAFSGEGARLYGGRWNRKGVPMVYTAGSQSLAMLKCLCKMSHYVPVTS
ncbi:MAG: RES domain-containing protein, partial [Prolixibacteraceae bacterium]|nr:RES domain-containing protein [Burkholderiales bacterium]